MDTATLSQRAVFVPFKVMQECYPEKLARAQQMPVQRRIKIANGVYKMASMKFDNIFDAVTDNQEESNKLQTCADLMLVIRDIANYKEWNHAEMAKNPDFARKHHPRVDNP
ncbi:hypothetical protein QWI17_07330 [Gilvimarinus sp. SDUM040013]|uniref:Uncharacterized protein n=1 Tax=Gilvimarinus gilvus TaxID=3058038 RepID=A0ABU4S660_9GAMM|nr:hypothetical protein [Gilvimarinus sp. SDUM040013]MDO3385645.1 hypothetical protein [Gilvimarinus sp. SDUM040013]MDX6851393.1 hypothetical protein [Gilvimarinus sp. SDUM040013]